jgi:hypothetical protein
MVIPKGFTTMKLKKELCQDVPNVWYKKFVTFPQTVIDIENAASVYKR